MKMSQSGVGVAPKLNIDENKKHRPSSLELSDGKKSDFALRIVSPGLPVLSEEMKSTIKLSQKIEQQQKSLIAARNSNSSSASNEVANGQANGNETVVVNDPSNSLPDEMDNLSTPTSIKRLKRENIPTPLRMSGSSASPMIQSAPIRQNRVGITSRAYPRRFAPYQIQVQHQYPHPQVNGAYRYMLPQPIAYGGHPGAVQSMRKVRMVPYTSSGRYFPFHHARSMAPSHPPAQTAAAHQKLSSKSSTVTDVYHGDYTKAAPLHSQPLSAQREMFDVPIKASTNTVDDDRMPVSEDEIKEMQEKYDNNVESVAIDEDDEQHAKFSANDRDHVFGSINFMNESVFNFKIFNQSLTSPEDETEEKDDLAKEKEKFLKICETSWDEFVNSRV